MSLPLTDSQRQALRSASHWYAVLSDERVSPQQTEKWQLWYEQNQDHQWAWLQVESLRSQMNTVPGNVAHRALQDTQHTRRRVMKGLLLLLGVGGGWQLWRSDTGTSLRADYTTAKGAIRQQRLEDGTLLSLNTDSAVNVRFDSQQRRIQLWYGEIAIATGQDASNRPFYVQTRQGQLTALGTEFTVRQEEGSTVLSVQHHAVKVVLADNPVQARIVRQGESLRFSAQELGEIQSADEEDNNWTQGILSFSNKPLGDVIATLSRYRHGALRCSPEVATLRLSGTFPLKNTDMVLQVIEKTLPVKIQYITRYWVNILPAN